MEYIIDTFEGIWNFFTRGLTTYSKGLTTG